MTPADGAAPRVLVVWCPAWERGAEPDARAFEQVVTLVEGFCPRVEVLRPGVCAISAREPARYFGGEESLAEKIIDAVACLGVTCQVGVADGLFAAQLAARTPWPGRAVIVAPGATPAFLAPYPVGSLGQPELADLLPRLGLQTLGEFAALPAAEAASRFGSAGGLAHRLAHGRDPRPLVSRRPSVDLSVSVAFDPPAQQAEPVVFAAKALAEQMHADLAIRGLACVRVQVQGIRADGQEITQWWRHDGLLSSLAVAERVRWQLASWRATQDARGHDVTAPDGLSFVDEAIPVGGITLLRLIPDQLVRATGRQLALWGETAVDDRVARAALRVQAMLGHGSVTRPLLGGGRGPAGQVTLVPFGDAADLRFPAGRPWPGRLPAPAPATVYPVPRSARVTDETGAAVTVTGRALISASPAWLSARGEPWLAITSWAGPWPVTERWWRPADSHRQARFQLVAEDGNAWLAVVQDGQWLIEASYGLPAAGRSSKFFSRNIGDTGKTRPGLSVPADTVVADKA
jgi:protein ImuB